MKKEKTLMQVITKHSLKETVCKKEYPVASVVHKVQVKHGKALCCDLVYAHTKLNFTVLIPMWPN